MDAVPFNNELRVKLRCEALSTKWAEILNLERTEKGNELRSELRRLVVNECEVGWLEPKPEAQMQVADIDAALDAVERFEWDFSMLQVSWPAQLLLMWTVSSRCRRQAL